MRGEHLFELLCVPWFEGNNGAPLNKGEFLLIQVNSALTVPINLRSMV